MAKSYRPTSLTKTRTDRSVDLPLVEYESDGFTGSIVKRSFNVKEGVFSGIKCFLNPTNELLKCTCLRERRDDETRDLRYLSSRFSNPVNRKHVRLIGR